MASTIQATEQAPDEGKLEGVTVTCPCHGSQFDVTSGVVIRGPAQRPVRSRSVEVEGDELQIES